MAKKTKILGAYEKSCPVCGGVVYKLKTSIGTIYQCKCGMCTQNNILEER
ncbi:hypothetical protein [Romboutsia maritimum]|nr:hypothetical protein [Romboutsia maritimum]